MNKAFYMLVAVVSLVSATAKAFELPGSESVLDPRQAFMPALIRDHDLALHWQIAPGYYLYRDKTQIVLVNRNGRHPLKPTFAAAERVIDYEFGPQQVYRQDTIMRLETLPGASDHPSYLEITYQGCKEGRLCYPPTTVQIPVPTDPPDS